MTGTTQHHIEHIDKLVEAWLSIDINPESKQEIRDLQANKQYDILDSKLSRRIAFGTAGLRSSMESGFSHMNDVTVLQASQGLVQYLDSIPDGSKSIVVGYDHRFNSQRFAEILVSVAISKGFKVYYLGSIENLSKETLELSTRSFKNNNEETDVGYVHTPLVPFAIDLYKAGGGVMITASHNPSQDNGFKVYYLNGCQIIPPQDSDIAKSIEENLQPWDSVWYVTGNFQLGINLELIVPVKEIVTEKYLQAIQNSLIYNNKLSFDFIYTPMHGVGLEIFNQCMHLFNEAETTWKPVEQQAKPDPNFPTVNFPNPEEKGALTLAIQNAKQAGYKLVIANDPDADRFSVAVETRDGEWRQLTGNEIGFLFAMYYIEEIIPFESLNDIYLVNSTVSSKILQAMSQKMGFGFVETLTGFKWIGNKAIDLEKQGYKVPFGYEEAIGFMFNVVHDKDGISAAVVWLQLYEKWFSSGELTPVEKLEMGYKKYGWFKEYNGYYRFKDISKLTHIFQQVRQSYTGSDYPTKIGEFDVVYWRDLTIGFDSSTEDNNPILPTDPSSQMISAQLKLSDQDDDDDSSVSFTCRGSGTEPKLKLYIEGRSNKNEEIAKSIAKKCWDTLRNEWFRPEEHGLEEVTP